MQYGNPNLPANPYARPPMPGTMAGTVNNPATYAQQVNQGQLQYQPNQAGYGGGTNTMVNTKPRPVQPTSQLGGGQQTGYRPQPAPSYSRPPAPVAPPPGGYTPTYNGTQQTQMGQTTPPGSAAPSFPSGGGMGRMGAQMPSPAPLTPTPVAPTPTPPTTGSPLMWWQQPGYVPGSGYTDPNTGVVYGAPGTGFGTPSGVAITMANGQVGHTLPQGAVLTPGSGYAYQQNPYGFGNFMGQFGGQMPQGNGPFGNGGFRLGY